MMEWLKSRQRVKYEGKYSFHLLLNTEQVDSSSTISITCFTDKTQRAAVPCNYIWFVIKNGLPQEVPDFRGCTFICDTACIGYYVQAHIISNDPECSGKAIVTFGPVELDVSLKTAILSAQSLGRLELPVYFVGPEQEEKEGTLELTDSQIRLAHNFSEANYVFEYSIVEPQITPNSREVSKASFFFNEKYEAEMRRFERKLFAPNDLTTSKSHKVIISRPQKASNTAPKLEVKFLSRSARDTFFFAMKAFIAKKEIRNSAVIRKIESINFEREEDFNAILEIDNLKCDLMRYDRLYKQALQEKRRLQEEVGRLERELERAKPELSMNVNYSATTRREEAPKRDASQMHFSLKLKKLNDQIEHARNTSAILEPQMALSPFSRLKEDDNESLVGLLADLSHCQPERRIERLEQEKRSLQLRLERSFEKINQLEQQRLRPSLPGSGINFTYKNSLQLPLDKGLEQLRLENAELRRLNSDLQHQNQQLKERLEWEAKSSRAEGIKIESHLTKIRDQNRTTDMLIEQERAMRLGAQVSGLRLQMSSKEKELQDVLEKCAGLQRRVQEAEMEAEMFRKNQDVLNRSQHMSQQMESYNEEQIRMLKEHNGFLLEENEKLVRACEKYMTDAKQNNKLRQEIIVLKERITKLMTNPEASFQ